MVMMDRNGGAEVVDGNGAVGAGAAFLNCQSLLRACSERLLPAHNTEMTLSHKRAELPVSEAASVFAGQESRKFKALQ